MDARASSVSDRIRRLKWVIALVASSGLLTSAAALARDSSSLRPRIGFELNAGQQPVEVDYIARLPGYTAFLDGGSLALVVPVGEPTRRSELHGRPGPVSPAARRAAMGRGPLRGKREPPHSGPERPDETELRDPSSVSELSQLRHVVLLRLLDASPEEPIGEGLQAGHVSYFRGQDPSGWIARVPRFDRVVYPSAWPGIDVAWYGRGPALEVDFLLQPGADPGRIRLAVDGAACRTLEDSGELILDLGHGELVLHRPIAWQVLSDRGDSIKRPVAVDWLLGEDDIGLKVGGFDPALPLLIDPIVSWSTLLDGEGGEWAEDVAADATGTYVCGASTSSDFPTMDPLQAGLADGDSGQDAFVTKISPAGDSLVYSTYFGGPSTDAGHPRGGPSPGTENALAIALEPSGAVHVAGRTRSMAFPTTTGAWQEEHGGDLDCGGACSAGFILKLDATGSVLEHSTYLGGFAPDAPDVVPGYPVPFHTWHSNGVRDIAVDASGRSHVVGRTDSEAFPLVGATQPLPGGGTDAFVAVLSADGSNLEFSTYLGGVEHDAAYSVAVGASGDTLVAGLAGETFPTTTGAFQELFGGGWQDGFVASFDLTGPTLAWSTFFGGRSLDQIRDIAVGPGGGVYMTGTAGSADLPIVGGFQAQKVAQLDAFVARLSPGGDSLDWSTWLGGRGADWAYAIAVDPAGRAHVAGETRSLDFPLVDSLPPRTECDSDDGFCEADGFVAIVQPDGSALCYSELFGGVAWEQTDGLALDPAGDVHLVGFTRGDDFPTTPGAYQEVSLGATAATVMKITDITCP